MNTWYISAVAGVEREVHYCTSKANCHMFTRPNAIECQNRCLRGNAVCSGHVRTPHRLCVLCALDDDLGEEDIVQPQGRIRESREVAQSALFPASGEASVFNRETQFVENAMQVGT